MKRSAIITGVCGQDGSYLAEFLLEKDYKVFGLKRRTASNNLDNAAHLVDDIEIVEGDVGDLGSLQHLCKLARPDEYYNLAAQSHVGTSFTQPFYTLEATAAGVLNGLEAIRYSGYHTRFYQASTSELFGGAGLSGEYSGPMDIGTTPFHPRSPYGVAKLYGYWITVNYRESYKMFACNGVLFNHESPRRGPNFVTRKICQGIAKIREGQLRFLGLGDLSSQRDWGHAKDYTRAMWMMLQHHHPVDYVVASGEAHSVEEFCQLAFSIGGLGDYREHVVMDPAMLRPAEIPLLIGDASRIRDELGWQPKYTFRQLVEEMVEHELSAIQAGTADGLSV